MRHKRKVLMAVSVASMIDQFNLPNIQILLEMGYEVHVACNFKEGNTCDRHQVHGLLKTLQKMHVRCHQWNCPRSIYAVKKCIQAYRQLLSLMEKYPFAWMHCQSPVGGAIARLAGHRKGIRMIYTAHGFHFYKGAPWFYWMLYYPAEKLLARWTDVVVTVNREDYRIARQKLKAGKVCYIPGVGIDVSRFRLHKERKMGRGSTGAAVQHQEFCRKYRIPENALILLSVGELSKRKNHQAVIAALAKLREKNIYYLICGQGSLKSRLEAQAQDLGVLQRVRLTGFQKDVAVLYQNADLFVFPSLQEGLPAALMEAMAAGLPCVVSDIRGNRELIDEAGGIRFALNPPGVHMKMSSGGPSGTLESALRALLEDEVRRQACGRYNQEKVKKYDRKAVNSRMQKIYTLLDGSTGK